MAIYYNSQIYEKKGTMNDEKTTCGFAGIVDAVLCCAA